jgi:hypothetical protein
MERQNDNSNPRASARGGPASRSSLVDGLREHDVEHLVPALVVRAGAEVGVEFRRQIVQPTIGTQEGGQVALLIRIEFDGEAKLALADAEQIGREVRVIFRFAFELGPEVVEGLLTVSSMSLIDGRSWLVAVSLPD